MTLNQLRNSIYNLEIRKKLKISLISREKPIYDVELEIMGLKELIPRLSEFDLKNLDFSFIVYDIPSKYSNRLNDCLLSLSDILADLLSDLLFLRKLRINIIISTKLIRLLRSIKLSYLEIYPTCIDKKYYTKITRNPNIEGFGFYIQDSYNKSLPEICSNIYVKKLNLICNEFDDDQDLCFKMISDLIDATPYLTKLRIDIDILKTKLIVKIFKLPNLRKLDLCGIDLFAKFDFDTLKLIFEHSKIEDLRVGFTNLEMSRIISEILFNSTPVICNLLNLRFYYRGGYDLMPLEQKYKIMRDKKRQYFEKIEILYSNLALLLYNRARISNKLDI